MKLIGLYYKVRLYNVYHKLHVLHYYKYRVFLGHFFTAASGRRSFDTTEQGRSSNSQVFPEAIEELVPNSDTVALVLRELATAAERWHDEL